MNDIVIKYGATYIIPFEIESDMDLTGKKLKFVVKRDKESTKELISIENVAIDPETKIANVQLTQDDWDTLPNKTINYEYGTLVYDDEDSYPFLDGKFKVEISVAG